MSFKCEKHGWEHHNTMCPICFQVTTSSTTGDTLLSSQPAEGEKSAKEISDIERCKYELLVEEYFKIPLTSSTNILSINDHTLVDFALFVHQTLQPSTTPSGEGMAEALRLKWINLTEDMGRLLSGQRGVSIDKLNKAMNLVQEFVNTLPASLSSPGSGWVKVEDGLPEVLETVWISNGKGWTTLGCRSDYQQGDDGELIWCWCATNGTIYEEDGKIVAECEEDDWDVRHWRPLPAPPGE